jgi:hypothetical protein
MTLCFNRVQHMVTFFIWVTFVYFSGTCVLSAWQGFPVDRYKAVTRYWEWSNYFGPDGLDYPGARYRPGRSFDVLVFFVENFSFGGPYWGFCSRDLQVCQSYFAEPDHSVFSSSAIRMHANETEAAALARFRQQDFASAQEAEAEMLYSNGPRLLGAPPGEIAIIEPSASSDESPEPLQTSVQRILLPKLGIPGAVRNRQKNDFIESAIQAHANIHGVSSCTTTVPYADEHAFAVPVLIDCPDERGIQFWIKHENEWNPTAGGWMPQPEVYRQFAPRIRRHASYIRRGEQSR